MTQKQAAGFALEILWGWLGHVQSFKLTRILYPWGSRSIFSASDTLQILCPLSLLHLCHASLLHYCHSLAPTAGLLNASSLPHMLVTFSGVMTKYLTSSFLKKKEFFQLRVWWYSPSWWRRPGRRSRGQLVTASTVRKQRRHTGSIERPSAGDPFLPPAKSSTRDSSKRIKHSAAFSPLPHQPIPPPAHPSRQCTWKAVCRDTWVKVTLQLAPVTTGRAAMLDGVEHEGARRGVTTTWTGHTNREGPRDSSCHFVL